MQGCLGSGSQRSRAPQPLCHGTAAWTPGPARDVQLLLAEGLLC